MKVIFIGLLNTQFKLAKEQVYQVFNRFVKSKLIKILIVSFVKTH